MVGYNIDDLSSLSVSLSVCLSSSMFELYKLNGKLLGLSLTEFSFLEQMLWICDFFFSSKECI